jgi:putative transposase
MGLESFSHGYWQCAFHIVLVPKFRFRLFVDLGIKSCCERALRETASRISCQVFALQVGADHVHIFVGLHPGGSVSEMICLLKCNSARRLFWRILSLRVSFGNGIFGLGVNSIVQLAKSMLKQSNAI